ncbi:response regulator [Schlesneria sp. T3-172]|uniref:response regulator n=1 Tax=Schlesneria sphaerica TaxID=3373610 RepID=UPI0037CC7CC2
MSTTPRILVYGANEDAGRSLWESVRTADSLIGSHDNTGWLTKSPEGEFQGALVLGETLQHLPTMMALETVVKHLPEGVAVLDLDLKIQWCNDRFTEMTGRKGNSSPSPVGLTFDEAFATPHIVGPDFAPFHNALGSGMTARTKYRIGESTYIDVVAAPILPEGGIDPTLVVVTVRDISQEHQQGEKLTAIHEAGQDLGDIAPEDLVSMSVDARKMLLREKIILHTKDVLKFETIEVRLLNERTNRLEPLLHVGILSEAAERELYALPTDNGVTGYVAATGNSYLCRDTSHDPLYLTGIDNASSSLTVPIKRHDRVLGTFNVESTHANAFTEQDQQFLELFCRDLSVALNTLELLVYERATVASESSAVLLREAARPVDEILNDIAWLKNKFVGFDPQATERLQRMLKQTRTIRQLIFGIGEKVAPQVSAPMGGEAFSKPKLRGKRVLIADADESVRAAGHELLARFGCEVETAHNGEEALLMIKSFNYDVVLYDAEMTDINLIEALEKIRAINATIPVVLMKGFGYDGAHRMVKALLMGFKLALYKPFRLDLLLTELDKAFSSTAETPPAGLSS